MRSITVALTALLALGSLIAGPALAAPFADCGGVGIAVDSASDVVVAPNGAVGCVVQNEATLNLYDGVTRAAIPLGSTTSTYTYDTRSDLTGEASTTPLTSHYDGAGRLVTVTNPAGTTTLDRYQYDSQSNLTQTTDATGNVTHYQYDPLGRQTTTTDALGNVTQTQYDAMDRVIRQVDPNHGDAVRTQYQYDAADRLVEVIDSLGDMIEFKYDSSNRLTEVDDPAGTLRFFYDSTGRMVSDVDQNGLITTFSYDGLGRLTSATDALGTSTAFVFTTVPEPGTVALLLGAIAGWAGARHRDRRNRKAR